MPNSFLCPLLGASLSLACAGCAFVTVDVQPPEPSDVMGVSDLGHGREVIVDIPFDDQRHDRARCGTQKNGYNAETADVRCIVPPDQWVAHALAQGLQRSGFRVLTKEAAAGPTTVRVRGTVKQFFVEPKVGFLTFSPEADIGVRLDVSSPSGLLAQRRFYFKAAQVAVFGSEDRFQAVSRGVTREAVQEMVRSIVSLLERYPELGTPSAGRALAMNGRSTQ